MTTIQKDEYVFSVDVEKRKNIIKHTLSATACVAGIITHKSKTNSLS